MTPLLFTFVKTWAVIAMILASGVMLKYAVVFSKSRLRQDARRLFLYTLIFLPVALILSFLGWNS